ncbi:group 2 sigma 70-type sigma factor (plasmid) [Fischerella sp. NIES-4106]|nr:group 2 sigma 70-type sigma factor [Fischerella sp. NIES-4106]
MVRVYLQEIAQFPLLTAEQEIAYATQVQLLIAIEQHELTLGRSNVRFVDD